MLASDFKIKARPFHIANLESPKNPKFLAINHDTISFEPDTYKGNKKIPRCLTIIRPLAAGWASAPYKPNQKGVSKSKLSEYSNSEETGSIIKIYAFEKASSNMEKGPRSDNVTSELQAGDALKFWMDEQRLIAIKRTIPEGLTHIEPFTLCEIQVAPRNKDAALKGNGCKLIEVKPTSFTLYSCMHDLERLPSTLADALTSLMRRQEAQPHIFNELVTNEPMFQLHIPHKAFIHEDPEMPRDEQFVTLVNTGIEPIDIPVHTLLLYTNSVDRNQACALLEIAIACSAVQMLVFKSDYWQNATQSQFRGVPVIDTELLLQPISPALVGEQTCFPTPNTMQYDDVNYNIQIQLEQEPIAVTTGPPPSAPDLVLASRKVKLERAYKLRFNLICLADGREIPRYWVGFFDASPRRSVPVAGYKRRRIEPLNEEDEEEDDM